MEALKILLVEDDAYTCASFNNYINEIDDIILVNVTNNATQALTHITHYKPDAIILDLELNNGSGNGFDVLTNLPATGLKPYVIVTTNNSSNTTYEYARHLGADFIMYKQQEDYSEKKVVDFLYAMKNIIKKQHSSFLKDTPDNPISLNKRILQLITTELDLIGINRRSIGYKYLVDAIQMSLEAPVPKICQQIANKYNKSEPSVERAMQNAINKAWTTSDITDLEKYYTAKLPYGNSAPTLTGFISYYVDRINIMI